MRKIETLLKVIQGNKAVDSLYQHSAFNPGQAPSTLIPRKHCAFKGNDDKVSQVMRALVQQTEFSLLWMVEVRGSKINPVGVGLVVQRQIVISNGVRYTAPHMTQHD